MALLDTNDMGAITCKARETELERDCMPLGPLFVDVASLTPNFCTLTPYSTIVSGTWGGTMVSGAKDDYYPNEWTDSFTCVEPPNLL